MKIKSIKVIKLKQPIPVYDLTVDKNHNFLVGDGKFVLHNCTDFHHGEAGIVNVINGMAQKFVGKNNINLLEPMGQFGNILATLPAAGRYTHTALASNFRDYYRKEDDDILIPQYSDDLEIEPEYYLPILPMILINGTEGIGTGFASKFMNHNPEDIKNWIISYLEDGEMKSITPWYKDFTGEIVKGDTDLQWIFKGNVTKVTSTSIRITDLPIGVYLEDIKKRLIKFCESGLIKDFDDNSTEDGGYDILITASRQFVALEIPEILDALKLVSKDTMNLTAWLPNGKLKNFDSVNEILTYFVDFRLQKYEERRIKQIDTVQNQLVWLKEKIKFIHYYQEHSSRLGKLKKSELFADLESQQFVQIDRLLDTKLYNLTLEQVQKLEKEITEAEKTLKTLMKLTAKKYYINELKSL